MNYIRNNRHPHEKRIILVSDNLNTHNKVAFYETFPPHIAYELSQVFEFHHSPVHGSCLDIAECELSALVREYLGKKRIRQIYE